jgi:tetratricopeptide (TPR) repeat protein
MLQKICVMTKDGHGEVRPFSDSPDDVLRRDEARVSSLLGQLRLLRSEEEQVRTVLDNSRFHSPGLAQRLLAEAAEARTTDAERARPLALMAMVAANQAAPSSRFPREIVDRLRIEAACMMAEVGGLQGRPRAARLWFVAAVACLSHYSCDAPERALLCRTVGMQRCREGLRDEALALLGRAMEILAEHGETGDAAEIEVELGWIYYDAAEPLRALRLFQNALELLPAGERPAARLRGLGGLALALADIGRRREADAAIEQGLTLVPLVPLVPHGHRFELARARVAELRGRTGEMAELLEALFRRLREADCPLEATMVGLDLGRFYVEEGKVPELEALKASLPPLTGEAETAVRAVWDLITGRDPGAEKAMRQVQEDLEYARHNPGYGFRKA